MLSNLALVRDLHVQWRNMLAKISPVAGYAQAIQSLKAEHNVDITCSASVTTTSSITDRTVRMAINRLCSLLSLARGCMISWIYYEVLSSNEQPLRRFHCDAITKPFSSTRELIASNPPQDTEAFIGQTYERYLAADKEFGVFKAIQAFTDAKCPTDFLQMRSLKAVVVMEYLVGRYVHNTGRNYIMSNGGFDIHRNELETKVGNVLEDILAPSEDQIKEMLKHIPGLNRYSFSANLSSLCGNLRLPMNSRDRRRFVGIRNRLVHEADYDPEFGTKLDQHAHLLSVVSKTLLGILRFEGYYIDPTRIPGWAGVGNPARVRYQFR